MTFFHSISATLDIMASNPSVLKGDAPAQREQPQALALAHPRREGTSPAVGTTQHWHDREQDLRL